ncbi:Uncharacterised protein [Mycobacterium tuberculosis]|uniref:Uncharacterized protein n=1 Tax=Mycobacterium tuberculosis TaxID=1773 RepID=A0A655J1H8_MYCTX|nr:Uncharacterised protein [Mycobacterium tuberculosis]CNM35473.1 Uncharacterised protein [Mycobacterium tuberculosis]CNM45366.1 Uncharacterised protein [Mycobacterium tuberculosis]CNM61608.1 Uncharacterised protein [Mycobacterium tuberculosis]COW34857.1 Uncharacterised protein [Mycobacterium tuberculosis]
MAEQLIADHRPTAAQHTAPGGQRVALAFVHQVGDGVRKPVLELADRQQQPGAVRGYQITRSAGVRSDHR